MGLFSDKVKWYYGSSASPVVSQREKLDQVIYATWIRQYRDTGLFSGYPQYLSERIKQGSAVKWGAWINWCKNKGYSAALGHTSSTFISSFTLDLDQIARIIKDHVPEYSSASAIQVEFANVAYWNADIFAEAWMTQNHPSELPDTELYTEVEDNLLYIFKVISLADEENPEYQLLHTVDISSINIANRFLQVDVNATINGKIVESTLYYGYGSGNSYLDAIFNDVVSNNDSFFPAIPIRVNNKNISNNYYGEAYRIGKEGFYYLYQDKKAYDDFLHAIATNKNVKDIDYAFLVFGVPLDTSYEPEIQYLYKYFENVYDAYFIGEDTTNSFEEWVASDGIANRVLKDKEVSWRIQSSSGLNFKYSIGLKSIGHFIESGSKHRIGECWRDASAFKYTSEIKYGSVIETTDPEYFNGAGGEIALNRVAIRHYGYNYLGIRDEEYGSGDNEGTRRFYRYQYYEYIEYDCDVCNFYKQIDNNSYHRLAILDLVHADYIYRGHWNTSYGSSVIKHHKGDEPSGFIIPIEVATFRELPIIPREHLAAYSRYIVCNWYVKVKTKWYKTFSFLNIFLIPVFQVVNSLLSIRDALRFDFKGFLNRAWMGIKIEFYFFATVYMQVKNIFCAVFGNTFGNILFSIAKFIVILVVTIVTFGSGTAFVTGAMTAAEIAAAMAIASIVNGMVDSVVTVTTTGDWRGGLLQIGIGVAAALGTYIMGPLASTGGAQFAEEVAKDAALNATANTAASTAEASILDVTLKVGTDFAANIATSPTFLLNTTLSLGYEAYMKHQAKKYSADYDRFYSRYQEKLKSLEDIDLKKYHISPPDDSAIAILNRTDPLYQNNIEKGEMYLESETKFMNRTLVTGSQIATLSNKAIEIFPSATTDLTLAGL